MTKYDIQVYEQPKKNKRSGAGKKYIAKDGDGLRLMRQGYSQVADGNLEEAGSAFMSAAEIFVHIENRGRQEDALMALGYVLLSVGRMDEAESVMKARTQLGQTKEDGRSWADWPPFKGAAEADGDYDNPFLAVYGMVRRYGPPPKDPYKLLLYAEGLDFGREFDKAAAAYSAAVPLFMKSGKTLYQAKALFGLANMLGAQEEFTPAVTCLRRCVVVCDDYSYTLLKGIALANLGVALVRLHNYREAENAFQVTLPILKKLVVERGSRAKRGVGEVLLSLGAVLHEAGRIREARQPFQEAAELLYRSF